MKQPLSDLIKDLLKNNSVSIKEVSEALGCTQQSFRNKLTRESFSIKDLMIISSLCHMYLGILSENNENVKPIIFYLKDYLTQEELDRCSKVSLAQIQEKLDKLNELISTFPEDERKDLLDNVLNNLNNHDI